MEEIKNSISAIYSTLGYGLSESTYQKALKLSLQHNKKFNIIDTEKTVPIIYLGHEITTLKADIVIDNNYILELKAIAKLTEKDKNQLNRYMKILKISQGLLVNFGKELEVVELNL